MAELKAQRGVTFRCVLKFRQPDGTAVDLTGKTVDIEIAGGGLLFTGLDGSLSYQRSQGHVLVRIGADVTESWRGTMTFEAKLSADDDPTEVISRSNASLVVT